MDSNNLAEFLFHQGTNFCSYDYLGCTVKRTKTKYEYVFRTWAPNADSVSLASDFTGWHDGLLPFCKTTQGIWECRYAASAPLDGVAYKFVITRNGKTYYKGDPYARYSRGGADGASLIWSSKFKWQDAVWRRKRKSITDKGAGYLSVPINIYEVHLGSFMRHENGDYLTYRELADALVPYLKYMGYTHVEFLPVAEHPFDGSWGYQVGAFFAPTSRFGTPDDFKHLINELHKNNIGVILDWVPAHFPKDAWGLYEFDGAPLYEYQGHDRQESQSWGTRFFDLGREEVQSFLISNALYFLREYHVDGLRVDAVASMIYLDYDKPPNEWVPNSYGGRENLEAIAFLRKLNSAIFAEFPDVLMIAEESGSFGGITKPAYDGGLGFNLKWNMGFANDLYDYVMTDPINRKYKHTALNFPIMYAFSEKYVLPISHDEVVHGKLSFINKMHGSYEDKFRQMRATLLLIMTYPGKKLLFMGTEYGQFREWDYENSLEWFMLDYPLHYQFREYVAALNRFYLNTPELWTYDFDPCGFEWINADDADKNTVTYKRKGTADTVYVAVNFSGASQIVRIPLSDSGAFECVFETELSSQDCSTYVHTDECGRYAELTLPPYSGKIFKQIKKSKKIAL